jgi:V/A-type H+-transporting ATPase subunit A
MLKTILHFHKEALAAIAADVDTAPIFKLPVREEIARAKYIPEKEVAKITAIRETISRQISQLQAAAAA